MPHISLPAELGRAPGSGWLALAHPTHSQLHDVTMVMVTLHGQKNNTPSEGYVSKDQTEDANKYDIAPSFSHLAIIKMYASRSRWRCSCAEYGSVGRFPSHHGVVEMKSIHIIGCTDSLLRRIVL